MGASLQFRLTGGSSNSDPDVSIGGIMSANTINSSPMNNLFDDVTPQESSQSIGYEDYRALDIYNDGDATAESTKLWVDIATTSEDSHLEIGYDASAKDGTNSGDSSHTNIWEGEIIANEGTVPASPTITFATRYSGGTELSIPNIPPSEAIRIWFKRVIQSGAGNIANDLASIVVQYA